MDTPLPQARRAFVKTALTALLALPLVDVKRVLAMTGRASDGQTLVTALNGLTDQGALWRIGQRYLQLHPQEKRLNTLINGLLDDGLGNVAEIASGRDQAALYRALAVQIQADFGHGRVVDVDGWRLSLSEARVCAVACLTSGAPV